VIARAIELDATGLATGPLTNWTNTGFIAGNFISTNANTPAVITADGVKGVAFLGIGTGDTGTHYVGPAAPAELVGASTRTVEAWVLNQTPQPEETVFAWGRRGGPDGTSCGLNHSTDPQFGAVTHWGAAGPDIGWGGSTNLSFTRWNHIAYTYDGTTVRVYADGVLANSENSALNTHAVDTAGNPLPFRVARQNDDDGGPSDTGVGQITIARVRVYTNALDGATIKARFDAEKADFGLTDPDGDGLPSWYEIRWGLNPNSSVGNDGAGGDPDADTLTNLQEYQLGTGATDADTDDDGLNDNAELIRVDAGLPLPPSGAVAPTDPLNPDTDGDGLRDGAETDTGTFVNVSNAGTDPLRVDTDGDGFSDGVEVSQGSNPTLPISVPSGDPVINLIATNLPAGLLTNWVSSGTFSNGFAFTSTNATVPSVQTIQGVNAVRFPGPAAGNPFYTGPTNPAAANVTGNKTYSVEAWVHNEGLMAEEVVIGWGRRGADGLNSSFSHGTSLDFGCMGHWGAPDLGYGGGLSVIENRWTHIVYTYNANTQIQNAYVDGVQVNTETLGAPLVIADVGTGGPAPFRVGAQNAGGGGASGVGRADRISIGELRVYTLNLSPAEVMNKFNTGAELYGITDKDGDGIPSWFERTYPTCLNENLQADGAQDCDGDGLSNVGEFQAGTNPLIADTDGDGLSDGDEVNVRGTNPTNKDTDQDGLTDDREIALSANPLVADSDSDGVADSTEVVYGSNPNDIGSVPTLSPPVPFVTLDATGLPAGALTTWSNLNALGWTFVAPSNAVANVESVEGTKGVTCFATNHYEGPNIPTFFGGDASRTVEAWIYNPTLQNEETVFAWGARGTDGRNSAFSHGADLGFGALQFWGAAADVPWGTNAAQVAQNVVTSRWTHVAYVYDNVSKLRACYANGALAYSETDTNVLNTFIYDPVDPLNAPPNNFGRTLRFRVGAQSQASGAFDAGAARPTLTIAKIRAYDQALSAAQIAANYNAERVQFPGAPRITNVRVNPANGFVSFDWVPAPGRTYEVLRNSDVANPNGWSSIATGQSSGSFTNDPAGAPRSYYRLRLE
jgi:hypothetical protein